MKEPTTIDTARITQLETCDRTVQIEALKAWCELNYEAGADTMVECWSNEEYEILFSRGQTFAEAFVTLTRVAAVHADCIADANFHRSQAG